MKKGSILLLVLALGLTACDALALPAKQEPVESTFIPPTAEIIVVTVEVPVVVTATPGAASPTPVPTDTQPPTTVPTETSPVEITPDEPGLSETAPTETKPAASAMPEGPVSVDASFLGRSFKEINYSSPAFSLRCPPTQIVIDVTANDPAITAVDFYYRIEDRNGTMISEWKNAGKMQVTGNGTFSMMISGESIHPDLRKALAWFDFQLVGLNKNGAVVGRTEKIVQLVTFTIDCQ